MFQGTTDEEEKTNWEASMTKVRQMHTNLTKIQMKSKEAMACKLKSEAHGDIVNKIRNQENMINTLITEYEEIVTTHKIDGPNEPTTVGHLKAKVVQDLGD